MLLGCATLLCAVPGGPQKDSFFNVGRLAGRCSRNPQKGGLRESRHRSRSHIKEAVFLWAAGHSPQASETHKAEKGTGKIYEDLQELFNFACELRGGLRS